MPPFRSYFFAYLLFGVLFIVLAVVGLELLRRGTFAGQNTALVIYAGAWVAVCSLLANTWSGWRTACTQMTLAALQTLRTDAEYLEAAAKVRAKLHAQPYPVNDDILNELRFPPPPRESFENPDFATATFFVLNQYEFLAAGARQGVLDHGLLKETVEGAICGLLESIAPFVRETREHKPTTWRNLVWLYRKFRGRRNAAGKLGPMA